MRLLRYPLLALTYFSIVTVVGEVAVLGVLWTKGGLDEEKFFRLLAAAHNVDLDAIRNRIQVRTQPIRQEHVAYELVQSSRSMVGLDLDLREIAADKGLGDIRHLNNEFNEEWAQYKRLKDRFDYRLEQLRQGAVDQALKDVQRQLESISPRLAKDQILRILDDDTVDPDASMQFVVTIFKAMPIDKRKKIVAEFKNEDTERLHEILRQIRLGVPDVELFRATRRQLQRFDSQR